MFNIKKKGHFSKIEKQVFEFFKHNYNKQMEKHTKSSDQVQLVKKSDLVVLHDLVNSSISSNKSNNYRQSCVQENNVTTIQNRPQAIAYCQRPGVPDFFEELLSLSTGIVYGVTKYPKLMREQRRQLVKQSVLHPQETAHDTNSLDFVLHHKENWQILTSKK